MAHTLMFVNPRYQPLLRMLAIDAEAVFDHPDIKPWRRLADRENCLLDVTLPDEHDTHVRWHIKRYPAGARPAADAEVMGIKLLQQAGVPTMDLVGHGKLADGRSFVIYDDLSGYQDAEKLIAGGIAFDRILSPTAALAAKLHNARLHHRDLYLCHFFAKTEGVVEVRLIDVARVRPLPRFFAHRWIVKDLAQFWYSTLSLAISDEQRAQWLWQYAAERKLDGTDRLRRQVERKATWIARHDRELRERQPNRNVSLPGK